MPIWQGALVGQELATPKKQVCRLDIALVYMWVMQTFGHNLASMWIHMDVLGGQTVRQTDIAGLP